MARAFVDLDHGAGNIRCQPSAVRLRDEDIASSVADERGRPNGVDGKAPRFEEGEVVVDPAPDAVDERLARR